MENDGGRFAFIKTRTFALVMLAAAAAAAGYGGFQAYSLKAEADALRLRGYAQLDLFGLQSLQTGYKARHGSYASDLETLLRSAPDGGAALRARLGAHTHLDTLVVAGDTEKFKLEANVRDPERTLLTLKGPKVSDLKPR